MNWQERLDRAEKRDKFSKTDIMLAESFSTCALGEKFRITDTFNDEGSVMKLYGKSAYTMAMTFFDFVAISNVKLARNVYNDIQKLEMPQRKICPYCDALNNNCNQKCRVCERPIPTGERLSK